MAKGIPTLKEIGDKYQTLAQSLAPVDTGKLRDSIRVSYKRLEDLSYAFDLNMVSYGLWWNNPPKVVKRVKLERRTQFNFVFRAQKDADLQKMVNSYTKAEIDLMVTQKMQEAFKKGGYGKLRQSFGK